MTAAEIMKGLSKGDFLSSRNMVDAWLGGLSKQLEAEFTVNHVTNSSLHFSAQFNNIFLNGMDDVPCMLLAGADNNESISELQAFKTSSFKPGKIPFVFLLNDNFKPVARGILPEKGYLIMDTSEAEALFASKTPLEYLKKQLRAQIPLFSLNPYSISMPARENMFFGRKTELTMLCQQENTNFGIVGPTRIGKSSLATKFCAFRKKQKGNRFHTVFINCYEMDDISSDSVACFVAKRIESCSRASETKTDNLMNLLKYFRKRYGATLELVLDEVDAVCETDAFKKLGEAAKEGVCRLILIGKTTFFQKVLKNENPFDARLKFIILNPLKKEETKHLVLRPMLDMGFYFENPKIQEEFITRFHDFTGGMSHLVQLFCDKLVEMAVSSESFRLDWERVKALKNDFSITPYVLTPLNDLRDDKTRKVAFELFRRNPKEISLELLQQVMEQTGMATDPVKAMHLCNDLIINNILIWKGMENCLPNKAIFEFARKTGMYSAGAGK